MLYCIEHGVVIRDKKSNHLECTGTWDKIRAHTVCNIAHEIIPAAVKFYRLKVKNLEELINGQEIRLKEGMKHYQALPGTLVASAVFVNEPFL